MKKDRRWQPWFPWDLTANTFDVPVGMEFSPTALHGLSHREVGDYSDAASYLVEVAEPMLDRIRGITDEELLMSGKDRFVMMAGDRGLLYAPIDENGWPIEKRVAVILRLLPRSLRSTTPSIRIRLLRLRVSPPMRR